MEDSGSRRGTKISAAGRTLPQKKMDVFSVAGDVPLHPLLPACQPGFPGAGRGDPFAQFQQQAPGRDERAPQQILGQQPHNGVCRKLGRKQIPGHRNQFHCMQAEDIEGPAAHPVQEVGQGVFTAAAQPDKEGDDPQADDAVDEDAHGAQGPLAHGHIVGGAGQDGPHRRHRHADRRRREQPGQPGLLQPAALFHDVAQIEVGHHRHALGQAEGQLPHKAGAPAQDGRDGHRAGYVPLGKGVEQDVQDDPAYGHGQQVPHGPAGEDVHPEIIGGVGQPQQKARQDLLAFGDGHLPRAEEVVVQKQMQPRRSQRRVQEGRQDAPQLLLDAFAHRPLAETVPAGYVEGGHQRLPVDEQKKTCDGQTAAQIDGIGFGRMHKDDGGHAYALEQVEHPKSVDRARFGSFHRRVLLAEIKNSFQQARRKRKDWQVIHIVPLVCTKICSNLV